MNSCCNVHMCTVSVSSRFSCGGYAKLKAMLVYLPTISQK